MVHKELIRTSMHDSSSSSLYGRISSIAEGTAFNWLIQMAEAMQFLSQRQIIHGRLCARHVAIKRSHANGEGPLAKLFGFGVTDVAADRQLDLIRWRAHEQLCGRPANAKGDVWSFGVLLWEVATLGGTPYAEEAARSVGTAVCRGLRLPAPPTASEELYTLALDCWQVDPDERPDFLRILAHLRQMQRSEVSANTIKSFPILISFHLGRHLRFQRKERGESGVCAVRRGSRTEGVLINAEKEHHEIHYPRHDLGKVSERGLLFSLKVEEDVEEDVAKSSRKEMGSNALFSPSSDLVSRTLFLAAACLSDQSESGLGRAASGFNLERLTPSASKAAAVSEKTSSKARPSFCPSN